MSWRIFGCVTFLPFLRVRGFVNAATVTFFLGGGVKVLASPFVDDVEACCSVRLSAFFGTRRMLLSFPWVVNCCEDLVGAPSTVTRRRKQIN